VSGTEDPSQGVCYAFPCSTSLQATEPKINPTANPKYCTDAARIESPAGVIRSKYQQYQEEAKRSPRISPIVLPIQIHAALLDGRQLESNRTLNKIVAITAATIPIGITHWHGGNKTTGKEISGIKLFSAITARRSHAIVPNTRYRQCIRSGL
jgi:hypothetical protein